jgi:hypothetical protein
VTALTLLALAVHGFHPYAEDGGLYLPEVKRLLRPELYPQGAEFVVGHLRYSIFAPVMAGLVRWSQLPIETVFLLVHLASLWVTLFAAWLLAARCYGSREARCGAVALLAVWITLPIAGTSLMLMDPYVTARSFSTPCALLALVGAVEFLRPRGGLETEGWTASQARGFVLGCGSLALAGAMHPLMGAYAFGCVLVLACALSSSRRIQVGGTAALCVTSVAVAAVVQASGAPESAAYLSVVLTRYYWFLSQWHWYERIGLAAPLVILATVALGPTLRPRRWNHLEGDRAVRTAMASMSVAVGATATGVAVLFARVGLATHSVARLQPLRVFQLVYVVMILVVGAALGEQVLQRSAMRWMMAFSLLAGVMVFAERQTYPASARIELPGMNHGRPANPWEQAFAWSRTNTPPDALFALDSQYINVRGEDAQGFRAIAERNMLPDYSKDGGVVANKPALTTEWMRGVAAQTGLSAETDAARIEALRPLGVGWVVLARAAQTSFPCGYTNAVVKVCRLP